MDLQTLSLIGDLILGVAALIASIAVPFVLYFGQKRKARLDYIKSGRDSWISIDTALIADPKLLKLADSFLDPESLDSSDAQRQKKWLGLLVMNVVFSDFLGLKYGYHEDEETVSQLQFIQRLMRDDMLFALSQAAYNEEFRATCRRLRNATAV